MQIFIVGNGRTGTNWMGQIIGSHPDVAYTDEQFLIPVARAAVLPLGDERTALVGGIIEHYHTYEAINLAARIEKSLPAHFVHKVHPALWMIDELAAAFPDAKFIAMKRDPVATVASMLNHSGVLAWHKLDYPSPFLGTTEENFDAYQKLEEFEKCAIRLKAHYDRIDRAFGNIGWSLQKIVSIWFEWVVNDAQDVADYLFDWCGLTTHEIPPKLQARSDTLTKWKNTLTEDQAERIRELMQVGIDVCSVCGGLLGPGYCYSSEDDLVCAECVED